MITNFLESESKPKDWPVNSRELKLENIYRALVEFKKNPGYRTREVVLALVNDHDLNQVSYLGQIRITDFEVELINILYAWGCAYNINCLKTYLYELIGYTTAMHKMSVWVGQAINEEASIDIKPYDEILFLPMKLYHFAFQKYNLEKDKNFALQIVDVVEEVAAACKSEEEYFGIAHAYINMLNDISYMKGNKRTSFWKFDREELKTLFNLEVRLIRLSKQNPYERPLKGVLMTQISNFILKSRNNYNEDYLCKYVPAQVAFSSLMNHQLWMRKTTKLNDEREEKVIPELFEDDSWIKYSWIKNIDFTETRTYYVSSFCKTINDENMKKEYGECIYGFKNDRIAELIGPIGFHRMKKKEHINDDSIPDTANWPYISQVQAFDVLYDVEAAKEELCFLFDIIELFEINDEDKKKFLQEILQYWVLSVKDSKWDYERERRYVIFLYDDYEYIELERDDTFLKTKTSIFSLPDFILGGYNPARHDIKAMVSNKLHYISEKSYLFCKNCFNTDYDAVSGLTKPTKCPICDSVDIDIVIDY